MLLTGDCLLHVTPALLAVKVSVSLQSNCHRRSAGSLGFDVELVRQEERKKGRIKEEGVTERKSFYYAYRPDQ